MKFQYVHTSGGTIETDQLKLIGKYVNNYLFSLIQGLRQQNFGFNTLYRVIQEIKEYRQVLGEERNFFIDSGGYSIIVGDVEPRNIAKFIECYNLFLEKEANKCCDFIFSLDIPIFLKYPSYNRVSYIYDMNSRSISGSKRILQRNPELYEKFIFVWQFKLLNQYKVWTRIYKENFADDPNLTHFGIGGLVGLRGITGIKFSPFIGMSYKCLDLIKQRNLNKTCILHILGVYGLHDKIIMSFLNKLYNSYYLKNKNCKIQITYDTINYTLSGLYKLRELQIFIPNENNESYYFDYIYNLIDKIHLIIDNQEILDKIIKDLNNINNNKKMEDLNITGLLNVINQSIIDKIIDEEIEKHGIVDLFLSCDNFNKFKNRFVPILKLWEKKYPHIYSNRTEKNLLNFQQVYVLHNQFENGKDLDPIIEKIIKLINFPVDLDDR